MDFLPTPLYGGAIQADIPVGFQDVSSIRQIPDTQEVYLHSTGYTSLVFDILERVTSPDAEDDCAAVKFHLSDIVDDDDNVVIKEEVREVECVKLPGVKAYTLYAEAPPGEKMRGREHEPSFVGVFLLVVRLEGVGTDFVVTVNVPVGVDGVENGEEVLEIGRRVRERVLQTLEVRDWGLFGSGE